MNSEELNEKEVSAAVDWLRAQGMTCVRLPDGRWKLEEPPLGEHVWSSEGLVRRAKARGWRPENDSV